MSSPRWQFWIDVGGTFTDCIALTPAGETRQYKTLSSGVVKGTVGAGSTASHILDARRTADPPDVWRGYRLRVDSPAGRIQERLVDGFDAADGRFHLSSPLDAPPLVGTPFEIVCPLPAPVTAIRYLLGLPPDVPLPPVDVRLGTTRGTNALITRTGAKTALVATRGFADILRIGYQTRPHLFVLDVRKPQDLFAEVVEIDERLDARGEVVKRCNRAQVVAALESLKASGVSSLAICLLHACANPVHERIVAEVARQLGFHDVSVSHEVAVIRKLVARGDTTVADAYLSPILRDYLGVVRRSLHADSSLFLMTSSGGLMNAEHFRGKDSILSGPAGGVVGVANVAARAGFGAAIGFDMGGTSTDVSRWAGRFDLDYETEKAGVRVVTPMMAIETVAAGGGSLCRFDGVKLTVGPESAGADPGPACYGRGGPLAVTDVNFYLGKILPTAFPFSLDHACVARLLIAQCATIERETGRRYTPRELADGYLRIANTNMVQAIRCVTVAKGCDPRNDVLVAFGGAAPQHACAVADELGVKKILLHPSAGMLSAFGIGLADVTVHREYGLYAAYDDATLARLSGILARLRDEARRLLRDNEPHIARIEMSEALDLRFQGLDAPLTVPRPPDGDYRTAYEQEYGSRFGYLPDDRALEVVTVRVAATATQDAGDDHRSRPAPRRTAAAAGTTTVYFAGSEYAAPIYVRSRLQPGDHLLGPAIITEAISTIVVDPGWQAETLSGGELLVTPAAAPGLIDAHAAESASQAPRDSDPVLLEVFNKRLASIATQMGLTLQQNARSVNVKERLDYSCAIFTASGELVVNAPHIPVHLGAMGETVRHVLHHVSLAPGDVVATNDPCHGGSHLPDVTVVTPIHDPSSGALLFFTASRAHHAEIGGIAPGSMPAHSRNLAEEGVLIRATKIVDRGTSRLQDLRDLLTQSQHPSRDPATNLADVAAQIAANQFGARQLMAFVDEYSWSFVAAYMRFIQDAAERKMRRALARLPSGRRQFIDHLDDGSPIALTLTIVDDTAHFDFQGTGPVLAGNLNANRAIVTAAVMYGLRCLIDEDIPLNEGVLTPIDVEIPASLLNPPAALDPHDCPAMAGGNVETSQRIVDVVLGALGLAAASQGTMNNLLFGDETFGYYETICGGAGATPQGPGADAVHTHMTNTRLTDPEVLESRFPVRLHRFTIRTDAGGAGRHRGGHGVVREIEFLQPMVVSIVSQRRGPYAPYGCEGGSNGALGENWLLRGDGSRQRLDAIAEVHVAAGEKLLLKTPGGGGWGEPV